MTHKHSETDSYTHIHTHKYTQTHPLYTQTHPKMYAQIQTCGHPPPDAQYNCQNTTFQTGLSVYKTLSVEIGGGEAWADTVGYHRADPSGFPTVAPSSPHWRLL